LSFAIMFTPMMNLPSIGVSVTAPGGSPGSLARPQQ
jgi:hypothetical protein